MRLINILFAFILFSCINTESNNIYFNDIKERKVNFEGYKVDFQKNWLLYYQPYDWYSEFSNEKLVLYNIDKNRTIVIADSLLYGNALFARFFDDSLVFYPCNNKIVFFNFISENFIEEKLILSEKDVLLSICVDYETKIVYFLIKQNKMYIIKNFEFSTKKFSEVQLKIPESETKEINYYCRIFTYRDFLVFNLNENLYCFNKSRNFIQLLSTKLSFNAYGNYLLSHLKDALYYVEDYGLNSKLIKYDLNNSQSTILNFKVFIPKIYNKEKIFFFKNLIFGQEYLYLFYNNRLNILDETNIIQKSEFVVYEDSIVKIFVKDSGLVKNLEVILK